MVMSIERQFKKWLEDKPMAKILVTKNSQMGYILEFAEYYHKNEIRKESALDIAKGGALSWSKELRDTGVIETIIEFVGNAGSNSDLQSVRYWLYSYLEATYKD